jgi:hypothetical protein
LHKSRETPKDQFGPEVGKGGGRGIEPWEFKYFKFYESQVPRDREGNFRETEITPEE